MEPIPTAADWQSDPADALTADEQLAQKLNQDAAASSQAIAIGIAAQIVAAAAPLAGGALAGPLGAAGGAAAGAAIEQIASSLASQHATALSALTPGQQQLATSAIQAGVALLSTKLTPKATP